MVNQYRRLPNMGGTPREVAEVVNNLVEGKLNSTGVFTILANTDTTSVIDARASGSSIILFTGLGHDIAHAHPWVSSRANGSFVVGHQNHGHDMEVGYLIVG
jgi:hypothetical protein